MPRESNWEVDELAQISSSVKMGEELTYKENCDAPNPGVR